MSEYVRFSTNVPEEVALRFSEGKQFASKIEGGADQMYYSLVGGRGMYVPLHVAERIREMKLGPGERFTLCKAEVKNGGGRAKIEWQVKRVDPEKAPPPPPVTPPNGASKPGNGAHTPIPFAASGHAQYALSALVNAIDLCAAAEQYAGAKGRELHFSSEDIRALAISFFIAHSRENGNSR